MTTSTVEIITETRDELFRVASEIIATRAVVSESYSRHGDQWRAVIVIDDHPAALDEI
jgi:hypothetical protein